MISPDAYIDGYSSPNDNTTTVVTKKSGHYQLPMQNILVSGIAYHRANESGRSSCLNQQISRNDSILTSNMELGSLPSVFTSQSRDSNQADCVGHFFSHSSYGNDHDDTISSAEATSYFRSNVFLQPNIPISSDLPNIDRHTLNNTEVPQQTIYFKRPKVDGIKPSKFNFPVELKNSKYSDYKDKVKRIQSFAYSTSEIKTPQQMSDAGFFAISNQDFVRCFHCGIGLRNWEDDDDPYVEHVRWSPSCQYMLNKKGKAFVDAVQEAVKKIQLEEALEQSETRDWGELDGAVGYSDLTDNSEAYPRHVLEKNPLLCNAAQKVVEMSYLPRVVKKAIDILILDGGLPGLTAERIANLVMDMESKGEKVMIPILQATESHTSSVQVSNDSKTLEEQNREFKEKIACVICCENQRCITFLPCGHLVCCAQCAPACNNCPVCRKEIKGTVKVNFH